MKIEIQQPLDSNAIWEQQDKVEQSRDNKSILEKTNAFFRNYANESAISHTISAVKDVATDVYERDDKAFQDGLKDLDTTMSLVKANGGDMLDMNDISDVSSRAKNKFHFQRLLDEKIIENKQKERINESIGNVGQMTSTMLGRSDIDFLTGGFATGLAKAGYTGSKLIRTVGAVESVSSTVKGQVFDDYTFKDGVLDLVINTAVIVPIANQFRKNVHNDNVKTGIEDIPSDNEIKLAEQIAFPQVKNWRIFADEAVDKRYKEVEQMLKESGRYDNVEPEFMEWQKDIQRREQIVRDIEKEADARAKQREAEAKQREADRIAEGKNIEEDKSIEDALDKQVTKTKAEQELEDLDYRIKETQDKLSKQAEEKLRQAEKEKQRLYYEQVFSSPKYANYNTNRREFFKSQESIIKDIKNKSIDDKVIAINAEIKGHKETIKSLNNKIKEITQKLTKYENKAVLARETNRLNKTKEELANTKKLLEDAKKNLSVPIDSRVIDSIRNTNRSIIDMADDIAVALRPNIDRLQMEINDLKNKPDYVKQQYKEEYANLIDELNNSYPNEMQKVNSLFGSIGKTRKPFDIANMPNLTKKQKGALVALGLFGGTSAFASDGEDDTFGVGALVMTMAGLYVLAPYALKSFNYISNNGLKVAIGETMAKITESQNVSELMRSAKGMEFGKSYEKLHDIADSAFNSTLTEIRNYNIPAVTKIFQDLLFDPLNGALRTADIEIRQMKNSYKAMINQVKNPAYKQWLDEKSIGRIESIRDSVELLKRFNIEIYDHISGIKLSDSPSVIASAKQFTKMFNEIKQTLSDSGVYGSEILNKETGDYITRMWNFEDLAKIVSSASKSELDELANNFSVMFKNQDNAVNKANEMLRWFGQSKNISGKTMDNIIKDLEEFFAEGTDINKVREAGRTTKDVNSRLKSRIEMDFTKWKDMTIGGKTVTLDTLIDRDVDDILEMYLNQSLGMIAFARRGYTSVYELKQMLNELTVGNSKAQKQVQTIIDMTLGRRVDVDDPNIVGVAQAVKQASFFMLLPKVFFSQFTEIGKSLMYSGLPIAMKHFGSLIKSVPKESELMRSIIESTGLGIHQMNQRLDIRGLDTTDLHMDRNLSSLGKLSLQAQEATARYSGLLKGTDFAQRLTALKFSTDFANLVKGLPNDIPLSRYKVYGIDDDVIKMFKDDFEFLPDGTLKAIDRTNWSYEKKTLFQDIAFKVNQDYVPETILSTVGLWSKSTAFGQAISFLTSYGTNLFSTQGRRDAHLRDGRAMWNAVQTFGLTYLGLVAKYEAEGKEYEDNDLLQYSFMNLPAVSLLSSVSALTSPAIFSVTDDAKKQLEDTVYALTLGDTDE